jgi:ATP-dependent Clp protease adaptor protein ClpS
MVSRCVAGWHPGQRHLSFGFVARKQTRSDDANPSPGCDPDERLAIKERERVERPKRFNVVLYNDDYTPMDFVVGVLERVFGKSPAQATQLMLQVHRSGQAVAGVYVLEIAETKVATVHRMAEGRGHPLRAGLEPE